MNTQELTPLFVQYYDLKEANPGCLLLMRVGDFFEAYGEDAELLSRDAEIALTSKEAGGGQRLAMAGVPFFSLDPYLRALVEKGHRVAVAEQMEDARQAKGLVRREVNRIVTAGTVLDPQMLDETRHNFLMCLVCWKDEVGLAAADISTGAFVCTEIPREAERVLEEAYRFRPSEIVVTGSHDERAWLARVPADLETSRVERDWSVSLDEAQALLCRHFNLSSLHSCDLQGRPAAILAAASILSYLKEVQRTQALSLEAPRGFSTSQTMILDTTSQRNLELTETLLGRQRKGSLLWAMDYTVTSLGARELRQWMLRPLMDRRAIEERQQVVGTLLQGFELTRQLRQELGRVKDIERLLARVVYETANARDLLALQASLVAIPNLRRLASGAGVAGLDRLAHALDIDPALAQLLSDSLAAEPPVSLREGGLIRDGYHAGLDELRSTRATAKEWIASLEERERELTGIRSLKVGFNQVFGYYLEVTRANQKLVPDSYIRKQTLANAERYFTPELKEFEARVLGAEDKIRELEFDLFVQIRNTVAEAAPRLRQAARAVAELDVLAALSEGAQRNQWVCPQLVEDNLLQVVAGRHPVVERALEGAFVPNDCELDAEQRLVVLTGPNMSGKSTYLRQNALIQIMAQMGSFVPARSARLGLADRVFTRVGASDDLHLGQSTFMVEMSEAANILLHATPRSLVILDEIGRGTSTYDGLALARAIAEHLYLEVKARTLFATHFHELTRLARDFSGIVNSRVAVQENRDDIIFLHKIVPGGADRSYGIYVAQLAGLPGPVLDRARALLNDLEKGARPRRSRNNEGTQLALFSDPGGVVQELKELSLAELTSDDAYRLIAAWKACV